MTRVVHIIMFRLLRYPNYYTNKINAFVPVYVSDQKNRELAPVFPVYVVVSYHLDQEREK